LNDLAESYKKINFNQYEDDDDFEKEISNFNNNQLTKADLEEEHEDAEASPYSNQVMNLFNKSFSG
jgi:hypothetical protein